MSYTASLWRMFPVALLLAAGTLDAQTRRTGTFTGVVLDTNGVPVPDVEVAVTKASRTARTDSSGKFILGLVPVGSYDVVFRRVAYAPMVFTIEISQGDTTEAEVKMNAVPQQMTTIRVEDKVTPHPRLAEFESRRRSGFGHFITREQIEKRNPHIMSDMFRTLPGTKFLPVGPNRQVVLRFVRAERGRDCPPTYFIDGILANGYNLDDMSVSDVEAVEVYAGLSTLPAQFAKARDNLPCGTVAIWTRIPGKKTEKK